MRHFWKDWRIITGMTAMVVVLLAATTIALNRDLLEAKGFTTNLLTELLSVIVTILAVSPFTAYILDRKKQIDLAPIRRAFFTELCTRISRVVSHFQSHFATMTLASRMVPTAAFLDGIENFNEKLTQLADRLERRNTTGILASDSGPAATSTKEKEEKDALKKISNLLAEMLESVGSVEKDLVAIERLLDTYMPHLEPNMVQEVAELSQTLSHQLDSFRALRRYVLGSASPAEWILAKHAVLDLSVHLMSLERLLGSAGLTDVRKNLATAESSAVSPDSQRELISNVTGFLDKAFYQKYKDALRRSD